MTAPALTFPSVDEGMAEIRYGGVPVGHVLARNRDWEAFLWPVAGERPSWCLTTCRPTLGGLREELRRRVATEGEGPWWTD